MEQHTRSVMNFTITSMCYELSSTCRNNIKAPLTTSQFILQVYHSAAERVSAIRAKEHGSTNLGADEQVGDAGCILLQLWHPFLAHILETGRVNHREADEEDIGHWVGQRPEAVVILLKDDVTVLVNVRRGGGGDGQDGRMSRHGCFLIWEMILMNYWGALDMSSNSRQTLTRQ